MAHCINCGAALRDEDRFCSKCGAPVGQSHAPAQAVTYETCEIKWRQTARFPIYRFAFFAEAIGPKGMYNAGQSKEILNHASPEGGVLGAPKSNSEPVVTALIAQLTAQGWEPVSDKGPAWWNYKFRRQVRP